MEKQHIVTLKSPGFRERHGIKKSESLEIWFSNSNFTDQQKQRVLDLLDEAYEAGSLQKSTTTLHNGNTIVSI